MVSGSICGFARASEASLLSAVLHGVDREHERWAWGWGEGRGTYQVDRIGPSSRLSEEILDVAVRDAFGPQESGLFVARRCPDVVMLEEAARSLELVLGLDVLLTAALLPLGDAGRCRFVLRVAHGVMRCGGVHMERRRMDATVVLQMTADRTSLGPLTAKIREASGSVGPAGAL